MADLDLWIWRHPRPRQVAGRCIGRTDVAVDPRKARRLAHRIRAIARRHGLPHRVLTSPLARGADVGRWLRRWGWRHEIEPLLAEMDFGRWEGRAWRDVPRAEFDAWCDDFLQHAPGDGESLAALFDRAEAWRATNEGVVLVVGHAGWMHAMRWIASGRSRPTRAAEWPAPPAYGAGWRVPMDGPR